MRLVTVEAVQVEMILDAPATTPQVAQNVARHAVAEEGIGTTEVQPVIDRQRAVRQFGEYRGLIAFTLPGMRAGFRRFEAGAVERR